jgi:hypothetical protein
MKPIPTSAASNNPKYAVKLRKAASHQCLQGLITTLHDALARTGSLLNFISCNYAKNVNMKTGGLIIQWDIY